MTMQVGLVGNDGIVLASDTRWTRQPKRLDAEQIGQAVRYGTNGTKIIVSHERGIVISCAEDGPAARQVADHIISDLTEADLAAPESVAVAVERITASVLSSERHRIQCLLVVTQPSPQLYRLEFSPVDSESQESDWRPTCDHCLDKGFAGDFTNPAVFWAERYHNEFLSVENLIPLAAHLIVSAQRLNSAGVDGLEIVRCMRSGIRVFSSDEAREWQQKSIEWDRTIGNMVLCIGEPHGEA